MNALRSSFLLVGLVVAGCEAHLLTGPPTLRPGRDECRECGMLINEDRCSSASILDDRGRRVYAHFDDLGCMLDIERMDSSLPPVVERHVRDYTTREWTRAEQAWYVASNPDRVRTPMGSGLVAFATRDAAAAHAKEHEGVVMTFQDLVAHRKAWMESRYGKPDPR